jgi:hypothetical protein
MIRNNRIVIDVHDIEEKKTDLPRVTDKLYHIMLYTSFWVGFELTMLMVTGTDCTVVVNLTTIRPRRSPIIEMELGFSMIWLKYWPSGVKRQSPFHIFHCIYLCIEYLKLAMLNLNTHTLITKRCTRSTAQVMKVYQLFAHGRWFFPGPPASSTIKTGRHVIAEILLKVTLKHQK